MRIIKEIRIGYFRSFSQKVEVKTIKDLNIFSGKNDSGKSNILKALNLFFSDEKVDFLNNFINNKKIQLKAQLDFMIYFPQQLFLVFHEPKPKKSK